MPQVDKMIGHPNIAFLLSEERLKKIGEEVVEKFEKDDMTREKWLKRYKKNMESALQIAKPKTNPWPNASNVKYPLISTAAIFFHAKAYPALVPTKDIVSAEVVGKDPDGMKLETALRESKYMSYEIKHKMVGWEEDHDRMLSILPITGCEFKKTYYDDEDESNISEHVFAKDLVVDYYAKTIEGATVKTQILQETMNEIVQKSRTEVELSDGTYVRIYREVDFNKGVNEILENSSTRILEESDGKNAPTQTDTYTPRTTLEQHNWLDLDEDGYQEPYIVVVDRDTKEILRITARYDEESIKRNNAEQIARIVPKEHFTKYDFLPNPAGGIYGIGFGILLGSLADSVDSMINQVIDKGTLSNRQPGFISRQFRIRGGNLRFKPGEWKSVNATGRDIREGVFPMPIGEPSAVLMQLATFLIQAGERLSSSTDMQVGENPGQNQKAATSQIVQENGLRVFTAIYKRLRKAMGVEFGKVYDLNAEYLSIEDYLNVIDIEDPKLAKSLEIGETDFNRKNKNIFPSADPNFIPMVQKLENVRQLREMAQMGGGLNMMEVDKYHLEALENVPNKEIFLLSSEDRQPPPDPKMEELRLKTVVHDDEKEQTDRELDIKEFDAKTKRLAVGDKNEAEMGKLSISAVKTAGDIKNNATKAAKENKASGASKEK